MTGNRAGVQEPGRQHGLVALLVPGPEARRVDLGVNGRIGQRLGDVRRAGPDRERAADGTEPEHVPGAELHPRLADIDLVVAQRGCLRDLRVLCACPHCMPPRVPPGRAAGRVLPLRRECPRAAACNFRMVLPGRWWCAAGVAGARWHSLNDMGLRTCARQNRLALDVLLAAFFVLLDTVLTLAGTSWWPAHPGTLAWAMLAVQGLADASLVFRRRAPDARHRDPGRIHPGHLPAHLARWPDHTGERRERVGALRNRSRCVRAVLLPQGPARGVRGRRHADAHRGQGLGAVRVRHHDRRAEDRGRAAARALLHRAARGPAGSARPGRTRRAGALPARRAGQGRGTGPARGRDARRRDAPGQPDGAAGRRAQRHREGRSDQAGRGRTAGRGLPGAG